MKTLMSEHKLERAQIIPIVVIGLIAVISMAALILDGGALMLNRRSAQNAADAGALAGARVLCREANTNETNIYNAIYKYTTTENHANIYDWDLTAENVGTVEGLVKGEVVVTAEIAQDSFFARIFNQNSLISRATAGAGCFPYRPEVVLPIAWSCREPAAGSASEDCDYLKLNWPSVKAIAETYLPVFPLPKNVEPTTGQAKAISDALFASHSSEIYIIMDSEKVCGGDINCDINPGDGINRYQLSSGGDRGWLNLTGTSNGANNLKGWIKDGLDAGINIHTWLSGIDGVKSSVYDVLATRLDEVVWVPIFNWVCGHDPLDPNNPDCVDAAHSITPPGVPLSPGQIDNDDNITNDPYFHVVGFAPFFITCVQKNNGDCPGFTLARDNDPSIKETSSLEGYFVDPDSLDGEDLSLSGVDIGVYTVSMTR